ncbi:acyl-coenzyme A thioesterase 13-like [Stylophora pistillata]|uniref:acyl-coenzyme A thioesterase 13-like n=1 Tax=Stylophora pistillata TaxID=50429 RepID=UPI000C040D01|nr:acyl-coenzyme A thioesterase 13-like [Stylophora pistillata]
MSANAAKSIIRQILASYGSTKGFDRVGRKIELLSMSKGKASFKMKVEESHQNPMGNLHGGMTATLIDMLTTIVITTLPPHKVAASVDLSISYLRPAPVGEDVIINTEVIKMGRTLAFTAAELLNKDGKLVAKARHTQFIGEGQPTPFTDMQES